MRTVAPLNLEERIDELHAQGKHVDINFLHSIIHDRSGDDPISEGDVVEMARGLKRLTVDELIVMIRQVSNMLTDHIQHECRSTVDTALERCRARSTELRPDKVAVAEISKTSEGLSFDFSFRGLVAMVGVLKMLAWSLDHPNHIYWACR
jgi:hypothetical protein